MWVNMAQLSQHKIYVIYFESSWGIFFLHGLFVQCVFRDLFRFCPVKDSLGIQMLYVCVCSFFQLFPLKLYHNALILQNIAHFHFWRMSNRSFRNKTLR